MLTDPGKYTKDELIDQALDLYPAFTREDLEGSTKAEIAIFIDTGTPPSGADPTPPAEQPSEKDKLIDHALGIFSTVTREELEAMSEEEIAELLNTGTTGVPTAPNLKDLQEEFEVFMTAKRDEMPHEVVRATEMVLKGYRGAFAIFGVEK